jgi:hypothetical protein
MKRFIAIAMSLALASAAFAGLGGDQALYIGGTVTAIPAGRAGKLDLTSSQEQAVFRAKSLDGEIRIPYREVTSLEYGQKAGRRVGAAVATAILVSPLGLALLFSHKRKHIVTIGWTHDGHNEGVVFEVGKNSIRQTLTVLEARTAKKVEYESEDARKNIGK